MRAGLGLGPSEMTPPSHDSRPVLISYDGSDFAKAAIEEAARQLGPAREAIVLTVTEPLDSIPFLGIGGAGVDREAVDTLVGETQTGARQVAEEGARLAREAGFDAGAVVETGVPIWRRVVEVAEERDAGLIALGSHGRAGLSYVLLGSVATAVAQHSKRSVLIAHAKS
jgi:nucleotide-binding universal stress UspA family protein